MILSDADKCYGTGTVTGIGTDAGTDTCTGTRTITGIFRSKSIGTDTGNANGTGTNILVTGIVQSKSITHS